MRLLTSLAGAVEQLFIYDAYGADLAVFNTASGALASGAHPSTTVRNNGENLDNPTQQYYFRARQYDPLAGRFPSLDPYAGDIYNPISFHKYGFVHGDPIQGIDPSGYEYTLQGLNTTSAVGNSIRAKQDARTINAGMHVKTVYEGPVALAEAAAARGITMMLSGEMEAGFALFLAGRLASSISQSVAGTIGIYYYVGGLGPLLVKGRRPVNMEYAGKTYFDKLPAHLKKKYPAGVKFDQDGFPDFRPYKHPEVPEVEITYTGSRSKDFEAANKAAGLTETPKGWTWHHHQHVGPDGKGKLFLVPTVLHRNVKHTGGVAVWEQWFPLLGPYKP